MNTIPWRSMEKWWYNSTNS